MELIGFNTELKDIWEDNKNVFRLNGMTSDEWVAEDKGNRTHAQFWAERDRLITENYQKIYNNSSGPSGFPLEKQLKMIQAASPNSLKQIMDALPQWKKLEEIITNNNGLAVGFDLETIGTAGKTPFAITELAIGTRQYQEGLKVKKTGYSFAFGIKSGSKEYNFIQDGITKFKQGGWDSLDDTERFSLERVSMYGHGQVHDVFAKSEPIDFLNNERHMIVKQLGQPTHKIETIEQGLKNLAIVNKEVGDVSKVFKTLINYIESDKGQESILFGANSEFDITGLEHAAKKYGVDFNGNNLRNKMVDIIYGARAMSTTEGISTESYHEKYYGKRVGAKVEDLLDTYGIEAIQTHRGDEDTGNEGDVAELRKTKDGKSFAVNVIESVEKVQEKSSKVVREYDDDMLFLINRGSGFDKNKLDVASVDGTVTQSYTAANEYWKLDKEHSGYIVPDANKPTEQKYVLSMINALDPNTRFSIEKDSYEAAVSHMENNMTWVQKSQLTKAQMREQVNYKYQDEGRRQFDKLTTPTAVGVSGTEEAYGFEEIKKYLAFNDELNKWTKTEAGTKSLVDGKVGVETLTKFIDATYEDKNEYPIHGFYQKQAFIGMKGKLDNEDKLLKKIITTIDSSDIDAHADNQNGNLMKTIAFKQSYNAINKKFNELHPGSVKKAASITMSDVFGIDIQLPNDEIKRVHAQKTNVAIGHVSRIFSKLTVSEATDSLNDLAERGVLTSEEATGFASQLSETGNNYSVYTDIGYKLNEKVDTYNDVKNPIKDFKKAYRDGQTHTILRPELQSTQEKLVRKFRAIEGDKRHFLTVNNILETESNAIDDIDSIVQSKIKNLPETSFIQTGGLNESALIKVTRDLAESLNIPVASSPQISGEHRLLMDMFNARDRKTEKYKKYSINGHHKEGVRTFLVKPKEKGQSAFLLMSNKENMNALVDGILNEDFDFSSRRNLVESGVEKFAGIYEIPYVNKYELEKAEPEVARVIGSSHYEIASIKQSATFERYLTPKLEVRTNSEGKIESYLNAGIYEFVSIFRQGGGPGLDFAASGEFKQSSRAFRKIQDEHFQGMPASSTYQSRTVIEDGKEVIKRTTNYNASDYMQAYKIEVQEGLENLFREAAGNGEAPNHKAALDVVTAFGENMEIYQGNHSTRNYVDKVMNHASFKEFFTKRILHDIGSDGDIINHLKESFSPVDLSEHMNDSIFDIVRDSVMADVNGKVYGGKSQEIIANLDTIKQKFNQIAAESDEKKGTWGLQSPGHLNYNSGLYSTMRPVYGQQNNGMLFSPDMFTINDSNSKIYNKAPIMSSLEYTAKTALAEKYDPFGDGGYSKQERIFMARYKQMSDYELQVKYLNMDKDSVKIAKELDIQEDVYRQGLDYIRKDLLSLNEGKLFHSPELNTQGLFTSIEAEKIVFDAERLDRGGTYKILNKLIDKEIKYGDVIGKTLNNNYIYHNGSTAILTEENVAELITENAMTHYTPVVAPIRDVKLMLNGAEKGTSHSIDIENFQKHTGIKSKEEAFEVANKLFKYVSDGAAVIGNLSVIKHSGNMSSDTISNTIFTEYMFSEKGQVLENSLNQLIKADTDNVFSGVTEFRFEDGRMIAYGKQNENGITISHGKLDNAAEVYDLLLEKITNNSIGDEATNKEIIKSLKYMNDHDMAYVRIQRQPQNEHMAKKLNIDQRTEQGIRGRSKREDNYFSDTPEVRKRLKKDYQNADTLLISNGIADGVNGRVEVTTKSDGSPLYIGRSWDDLLMDDIKQDARSFDGKIKGLLRTDTGSSNQHIIEDVVNHVNVNQSGQKIQLNKKNAMLERSIAGIIEATNYAYDNSIKLDKDKKEILDNIVHVDFENIKKFSNHKNVTADVLIDTLFFKEGTPSETLTRIAEDQGVELKYSKSIKVDLNGLSFKHDKRDYTNILIPVQNITVMNGDTSLFQEQQRKTRNFLRGYMELINEPGERSSDTIAEELKTKYVNYMTELTEQLNPMKKDTDLTKAFNKTALPNSSGFLAQDEIPALVSEMIDDDMQSHMAEKKRLEKELANSKGTINQKTVKALDKEHEYIDNRLKDISTRIKDGIEKPMSFVSLEATNFSKLATVKINNKEYYGYTAALSKEGFKASGLDFGINGLQLIDDLEQANENGKTTFAGIDKLDYGTHKTAIVKKLNALNINGLDVDETKKLMPQLEEYFLNYYKEDLKTQDFKIDTRAINNAIENKDLNKIFGAFEGVTEEYLQKEGMFGILHRFPSIQPQPTAKFFYDSTMDGGGLQMRMFSPLASATTNVDFDGDNTYEAFRLNSSVLLRETDDAYHYSAKSYEDGAKGFNQLMAEVILDGDALKSDNVTFGRQQTANMLETFRKPAYEKAVIDFASNNNYDYTDLTKAQEFAANQSDEVLGAFRQAKLDTLTDEQLIIASTTPSTRKINIGSISTPNFKIREVINQITNGPQEKELGSQMRVWSEALANMNTKSGGLLAVVEQKGIDVKHIVDAMNTAQTVKWATGTAKLFGAKIPTIENNISAMNDLLAASNGALFKTDKADLDKMARTIVNTSFVDFQKQIAESTNPADIARLKNMMAFRGLLEFQNVKGFNEAWQSSLLSGTFGEGVYNHFQKYYQNYDKPEFTSKFRGTVLQGITDNLKDYTSGERIKFKKDVLYFNAGTIGGIPDTEGFDKGLQDTAFVYKGKGQFASFNLNTHQVSKELFTLKGTPKEINEKGARVFNSDVHVNLTDFIENEEIQIATKANLATDKFRNLLNDMVLDGNKINKEFNMGYIDFAKASGWDNLKQIIFGRKELTDMGKLFVSKEKTPEQVLSNVNDYVKAYDLHQSQSGKNNDSGADLIRKLNQEIAEDRRRKTPKTESYDDYFKERLLRADAFGSESVMNRFVEAAKELEGFNDHERLKYKESISFLNDNLYDIIKEQKKLSDSFDNRQLDFNEFSGKEKSLQESASQEFDMAIKPLKELLINGPKVQEKTIKNLNKSNDKTVSQAQKRVYDLFKDEKQMSYFFQWNKPNNDSRVGFGKYMGISFRNLSEDDIKIIKKDAFRAKEELTKVSDSAITSTKEFKLKYHAVSETLQALKSYTPDVKRPDSGLITGNTSDTVNRIIKNNEKTANDAVIKLEKLTRQANKKAKNNTTRKTITNSVFDSIKDIDTKTLKGVGIVVGAMAALGIANNLLHQERTDSPLKPARKKDGNTKPNMWDKFTDGPQIKYKQDQLQQVEQQQRALKKDLSDYGVNDEQEMTQQAPSSPITTPTVYHDRQSGLNFKVSAKTKSKISDANNAKLIKMAGGGNAAIQSQADTSGVTDNWLANKFAELV